jgi:hypothetical protein
VVARRPGTQGAWFITHWPETLAVLDAARVLGVAIQGSEDGLGEDERTLFAQLGEGGRSAASREAWSSSPRSQRVGVPGRTVRAAL